MAEVVGEGAGAEPAAEELSSAGGAWFPAAPPDRSTKALTGLTLLILGALVLGGVAQAAVSVGDGDLMGVVRGVGYGALALVGLALTLGRTPRAYRLERDRQHGPVLVVERRWSAPLRLALADYRHVLDAKRVVFPWVPLLSGSRLFGLRGARVEEMLAGFWSFGRDGRRALVLTGPGRPRTLVAPLDREAMLAALMRLHGSLGPSGRGEGMDVRRIGRTSITLKQGDITEETADAIVNAANSGLLGGGGVDGAIHRAGGPEILEECRAVREARGPLPPGEAVATTAGRLHARRVVHAVGPVWHGGAAGEEAVLRSAYRSSLSLAVAEGLRTVAFPSISTGAYGYPVSEAADAALSAVAGFVAEHPDDLDEVRFVLFDGSTLEAYRHALESVEG